MQYTSEKPADPIELRIYPGADGAFTIYEDEGDNYNYESGAFALIPLRWDDKSRTLSIGARQGSFPGMIERRTFNITVVKPGQGAGVEPTTPDLKVDYTGKEVSIKVPE